MRGDCFLIECKSEALVDDPKKVYWRESRRSAEGKKKPDIMSFKNIKNRYLEKNMDLDYTVSHMNVS